MLVEYPVVNAQRQWYLYDTICEHVKCDAAKDITCPLPTIAKPAAKTKEEKEELKDAKKRARGDA